MAQSRNKILPGGVTRYGRSAMYKRKVLYMRKKNPLKVEKVAEPTTKTVPIKSAKGKSNGESRTVAIVKPVSAAPCRISTVCIGVVGANWAGVNAIDAEICRQFPSEC